MMVLGAEEEFRRTTRDLEEYKRKTPNQGYFGVCKDFGVERLGNLLDK